MTVLTQANRQWESRPADERYGSLADMFGVAVAMRDKAAEAVVPMRDLKVVDDSGLSIVGPSDTPALLTNFSFGQLATKTHAPAGYLKTLPNSLAVSCLNNGLEAFQGEDSDDVSKAMILFDQRDRLTARGITSEDYSRIWNGDVIAKLMALEAEGTWQPAPAAFDGSRGLYMGDRDMFAFMVDNARRIFEKGPGGGLSRGFFCWNGEVGDRSIGIATFLYEYICGNHRVWGVSDVKELRIAHIHTSDAKAWDKVRVTLKQYADSSAEDDEAKVAAARTFQIAASKSEVIDMLFGKKVATRKLLEAAYTAAEAHDEWYGSPRSAWGMAGGMTEVARDLPNADDRTALDRAATKVMEMAF